MNRQEFAQKHCQRPDFDQSDVLMRISANLSDLHIEKEFFTPEQMDAKLNAIKEYISDYRAMSRLEEMNARHREQEMQEFYNHLGR
jgi:23S rRNA maturation-related 3'-5' exoribonuclease YhaM